MVWEGCCTLQGFKAQENGIVGSVGGEDWYPTQHGGSSQIDGLSHALTGTERVELSPWGGPGAKLTE